MSQNPRGGERGNNRGVRRAGEDDEASLIVPPTPEEEQVRRTDPDLSHTDELVSRADVARAHDRPRAPDGELAHRAKSPPQSPQEVQALREGARDRDR